MKNTVISEEVGLFLPLEGTGKTFFFVSCMSLESHAFRIFRNPGNEEFPDFPVMAMYQEGISNLLENLWVFDIFSLFPGTLDQKLSHRDLHTRLFLDIFSCQKRCVFLTCLFRCFLASADGCVKGGFLALRRRAEKFMEIHSLKHTDFAT